MLEAVLQRFNFLFIGGDLFALFFNGHAAVFQIGKQILEGFVLLLHLVFRLVDDIIRQPQLAGNGKCITFSWNTDEQAVGRAESLDVELAAGIFNTWRGQRKTFNSL